MTSYVPETDGYVYIVYSSNSTLAITIDGYIALGGVPGNYSMFVKGGCTIYVQGSGTKVYFAPLSV